MLKNNQGGKENKENEIQMFKFQDRRGKYRGTQGVSTQLIK